MNFSWTNLFDDMPYVDIHLQISQPPRHAVLFAVQGMHDVLVNLSLPFLRQWGFEQCFLDLSFLLSLTKQTSHLPKSMLFEQEISYVWRCCDMHGWNGVGRFYREILYQLGLLLQCQQWVRVDHGAYILSSWCVHWLMREATISKKNCLRSWLQWCQ